LLNVNRKLVNILLRVSELGAPSNADIKALRSELQRLINSAEYRQLRQKMSNLSRIPAHMFSDVGNLIIGRQRWNEIVLYFLEQIENLATSSNESDLSELSQNAYEVVRSLNTSIDDLQTLLSNVTQELGGIDALIDYAGSKLTRNPWFSGSFYLTSFAVVIALISVSQRIVAGWSFPLVLAAGIVSTTLIGALQLRNDDRLSEMGFLTLVELSFKQIFKFFSRARPPHETRTHGESSPPSGTPETDS